jgi:hypothetical protein
MAVSNTKNPSAFMMGETIIGPREATLASANRVRFPLGETPA